MNPDPSDAPHGITFVLLHFNTLEHTVPCVESLLGQKNAEVRIVVVDNASTNDSGRLLAERYGTHDRVTLLTLPENLGYARGINVGYRHAKEVHRATCICLSNNDIIYGDPYLARTVCSLFAREKCDVLGPAIYVPERDIYQNPQSLRLPTLAELDRLIWRYRVRRLRLQLGRRKPIGPTNRPFGPGARPPDSNASRSPKPEGQWNVQLHGCTFFLGPRFVAERDGMNPSTHFCCEEDILFLECLREGYSILYSDEIEVIHNAHSTLRGPNPDRRKADIRFLDHQIASTRIFRRMLKETLIEQSGSARKSEILFSDVRPRPARESSEDRPGERARREA